MKVDPKQAEPASGAALLEIVFGDPDCTGDMKQRLKKRIANIDVAERDLKKVSNGSSPSSQAA
ncbi:MAG: hypothetical protein OXQ30_16325 [Boseongicola sp.]|nr:hypothetical protein [Boseongicola sp.]